MNIEDFEARFLLRRQDYGVLYPYIVSEDVTDINWNGRQLWIDDLKKGKVSGWRGANDGIRGTLCLPYL